MPTPTPGTTVERVEVFVDQDEQPFSVLTAPPYLLRLDTGKIPDGDHTVRVVTVFKGGGRSTRLVPVVVKNLPTVLVEGLSDDALLSGPVDLNIAVAEAPAPPARAGLGVPVLLLVGVLVALWACFAFVRRTVPAVAPPEKAAAPATPATGTPPPVDQALLKKGAALYAETCAGCHQAGGEGIPSAFPPLANDANLADARLVIDAIIKGKSGPSTVNGQPFDKQMPPQAQLSDEDVAALATFIRQGLGNHFGGVSVADVAAARARSQ
jgi:cytochrome c oxidase subunit 2